ncbi:TIGR03943 family protein [Frigoribacterium sp. CG_9.8]|uniref:TIGR03943 family putative permease subunit n=1 Tax=Frigoribacterium sp. CG_9.8 TaxID=2787733 RepID=UPI001A1FAE7B|nr:TIGR03943 family protein [Frigoribacterium sp. CG_9.8]MBG6107266.1 putative repeat protein (TIGR03943 family) [Frigoribacterium sp. CG_9.8]
MPRFTRWQGIALCVAALVSTVWLAVTNQLILYIHPRYIVFTVIMAALGLVLVVASFRQAAAHTNEPANEHEREREHEHELEHEQPSSGRLRRGITVIGSMLTLVMAVALVVVPPTTLTTATAEQRVINSTQVGPGTRTVDSAASAPAGAYARFTVLDWSSLLRQTTDVGFYREKEANVVGFITRDKDDPKNVFYVSRFVITCCAVDAQPVGVPVYLPNWQDRFAADQWVKVSGSFETNPSTQSQQSIALVPTSTTKVDQPSEPYLY